MAPSTFAFSVSFEPKHQTHGIDHEETFAFVAKMATVCSVIAVVVALKVGSYIKWM